MPLALKRVWLSWIAFVVYGSLLPFQWRAVPWDQAIATVLNLPWLEIGLGGRLDWLANVFLYIPVGWLGVMVAAGSGHGWSRKLLAGMAVLAAGATLAVGIEFLQIFFEPRTVSLNDLAAELAGTALGCAGGLVAGPTMGRLLVRALNKSDGQAWRAWLQLYLLIYLALSFFPFDFSTATAVLEQKLRLGHAGWWWAPLNQGRPLIATVKLAAEVLLVLPFGWALARGPLRMHWLGAAVLGAIAGAVIEGSQLFLLSATSQGASVVSRAIGMALGAVLAPQLDRWRAQATPARTRALVMLLALPWFVLLAALAGWGQSPLHIPGWAERAAALSYLPLYYHYFVGESRALTSVLLCAASYAGVGVAAALAMARTGPALPAGVAFVVSAGFEASQLFLLNRHPDPSNAWIAALAAWLAFGATRQLHRDGPGAAPAELTRDDMRRPDTPVQDLAAVTASAAPRAADRDDAWGLVAALVIVGAAQTLHGHPAGTVIASIAFAICLWFRPGSLLLLAPVVVTMTDVDTYTGVAAFNLLDGLMLCLLGVALAHPATRARAQPGRGLMPRGSVWLLALLPGLAVCIAGIAGTPSQFLLTPIDPKHGLLLSKGLLWALVLALSVHRLGLSGSASLNSFGRGMCLALAGIVALTVYERLAFVGPFDFTTTYRAPGPFTAIALGGAYIECFLAAAVPFAVVASLQEPRRVLRWVAGLLVLGATYATMVTFSRGGQVVFLFVVLATAIWTVVRQRRVATLARSGGGINATLLLGIVATLSVTILMAPFASTRFHQVGNDARVRLQHWQQGLGFSRGDASALAFGNGQGSYGRESYVQGDVKGRPGIFVIHDEAGNAWVRAHAGQLSYLDQRVAVRYGDRLTLRARVRANQASGVQVILCEKDLVQSFGCGETSLKAVGDGQWQEQTLQLTLPPNPQAGWPPRPQRFTLFKGAGSPIDVDDLSLVDGQGRELLANGNFEAHGAHWLYSSDMHLIWHLKQLWLQVFFESGLIGVLGHALLLSAGAVGARRAARGNAHGFALLMALLAFQGVGLIDSVIDAPRFLLLYLALALLGCAFGASRASAGAQFGSPRPRPMP